MGIKVFDRKDTPRVNEYMYSRARSLLSEGKGVMFDSAYKLKEAREKIYAMGSELRVPVIVIECVCSAETSISRMSLRVRDDLHTPSNSAEVYREYAKMWESPQKDLSDYPDISLIQANTDTNTVKVIYSSKENKPLVEKTVELLKKVIAKN